MRWLYTDVLYNYIGSEVPQLASLNINFDKSCIVVYHCLHFFLIDPAAFPVELGSRYGLTIEVLRDAFESDATQWCVRAPDVGFYRVLHLFLKKWDVTRTSTKTSVGKFYLAIDERLQERRSSPCNTYKFIEQLVSSDIPDTAPMSYGLDKQLGNLQAEIQDLNIRVQEQQVEIDLLQREFKKAKSVLIEIQNK